MASRSDPFANFWQSWTLKNELPRKNERSIMIVYLLKNISIILIVTFLNR